MGDIAIRAENLSKAYRITATHYRHDTLRGHLAEGLKSMLQGLSRSHSQKETFWSLRDVSFEVKRGDTVGIVGRNGAGKSTLLKILSRITDPTSGRAEIYGRIGSLLEVGTGFDHDLTGLENIYLSGAILGMKKAEIVRLGLQNGAPLELSWSCYQESERACGNCDSCALRLRAFRQAGAVDPVPYLLDSSRLAY